MGWRGNASGIPKREPIKPPRSGGLVVQTTPSRMAEARRAEGNPVEVFYGWFQVVLV